MPGSTSIGSSRSAETLGGLGRVSRARAGCRRIWQAAARGNSMLIREQIQLSADGGSAASMLRSCWAAAAAAPRERLRHGARYDERARAFLGRLVLCSKCGTLGRLVTTTTYETSSYVISGS